MDITELTFTTGQYRLVYQAFSLAFAGMFAAFVYFTVTRRELAARYRTSALAGGLLCLIAAYHYLRIFESWNAGWALEGGQYVPTGEPFSEAYRYADWLLTVPLLMVELVAILGLTQARAWSLKLRLIGAAIAMIVLGYFGQSDLFGASDSLAPRLIWGTLSSIPFAYLLVEVWRQVGGVLGELPPEARRTAMNVRLLFLASWGVYPIAYLVLTFSDSLPSAAWWVVGVQLAYTMADLTAKPGYGLMLHKIAKLRSEAEGYPADDRVPIMNEIDLADPQRQRS